MQQRGILQACPLCLQQRWSLMSQWCTTSTLTSLFIVKAMNGMVSRCLTAVFPLCYKQHQQLIFISLKKQPTFELSEGKKNVQNALPEE